MSYLTELMGIQVQYKEEKIQNLPNYILSRYLIKKAFFDKIAVLLAYPKEELGHIQAISKHLKKIEQSYNCPVVLVLERLTYRERCSLIKEKIPFIVENKQIYLPFMAIYLQSRCDAKQIDTKTILPSAQILILYYIYHGTRELILSDAGRALNLTPTSMMRASKQLEEIGLVLSKKCGVQKIIFSKQTPLELYESAKEYIQTPIKRVVYIPKNMVDNSMVLSGYCALAHYSMLNEPRVLCYATNSITKWKNIATDKLMDADMQCELELWRYNPRIFSAEGYVDELSLALAYKNEVDERVEEAVEEMLDDAWRKINGKWNK